MQRSTKLEACTRLEEKLNAVAGTEGERKQVITGEIHVYGIEEERLIGGDRVIGAMGHLHGAVNKGMRVYLIPFPIPCRVKMLSVSCKHARREKREPLSVSTTLVVSSRDVLICLIVSTENRAMDSTMV